MKETSKCLEYYLDSKVYNYEDVEKNIEETKKDFPKKKFSVNKFVSALLSQTDTCNNRTK